jgi:hypothetical protein
VKITAIESLQWAEYPRLLVLRVHTDRGPIRLGETADKIPGAKGALHGTIAPLVLHNVTGPICHAAVLHLGAHIPNLYFVESVCASYQTYFPVISGLTPQVIDGISRCRRVRGWGYPCARRCSNAPI